jgi:hypothetical protein
MIFLTEHIVRGLIQVNVYESLEDLSQRIEWQDILSPSIRIIDENGQLYACDDSRVDEEGTVYNFHSRQSGPTPGLRVSV